MARALPGRAHGDATRYDERRERVLRHAWHLTGDRFELRGASAVPVSMMAGSLDVPLVMTADAVLSNACTHRGRAARE